MSRRAAREAAGSAKRARSARAPKAGRDGGAVPPAAAESDGATGLAAFFGKHPRAWLAGAGAVVFLLLGSGAVFAGVAVGSAAAPAPTPTESALPPRELPAGDLAASRLRTCSVAGAAADPRLGTLVGSVVRADTGESLFDRAGDGSHPTSGVLQLLTASAAVAVLGPDFQITTSVLTGSSPGTIVLVGRGDATLSALPPGAESVYRGAPKLADLAASTLASYNNPGVPISNIVLDSSYWSSADKWDPSWPRTAQTRGSQSEVTALQIDGDRADPTRLESPRGTDPIGRAGQAFLQALRDADTEDEVADNVSITLGTAVGGSTLAEAKSRPLRELLDFMLKNNDNTLAEMIARITSKQSALNGSAASLQQSIPSALNAYGVPASGMSIKDGSGLSPNDTLPPSTVTALLVAMHNGGANLDVVRAALPVAGQSGTLAGRFTGDSAVARGAVQAKTGSGDGVQSLAGFVQAADGTPLAFAFSSLGAGDAGGARAALDALTTAVHACGDNLSNN